MRQGERVSPILPAGAAFVLLADQAAKQAVRANLRLGQSIDLVPWIASVFRVTYVTNSGAAFGLFPGWSQFLVLIALVVIVALVWYSLHLPTDLWLIQLSLSLQLGGATSNLVDRLRFGGFVVDFIDLSFWPLRRWPVFNLADASIVGGVTLLTLLMLWEERRDTRGNRRLATAQDD